MKKTGVIGVIIAALSLAIFFTIYDSNKINKLHKEYKEITTNNEFNGIITNLYTTKGASFLILDDSMKIRLHTSKNSVYLGKNAYLDGLLSIGDVLIKNKGTDTLTVRKQNKEYYFVLGKFINKK